MADNNSHDGGDKNEEMDDKKGAKYSMFRIDTHMIPCKITYLFWGGVIGTNSPFLNPFFVSLGLTTSQAGFITGFRSVASLLANPFWGFLADYSGRRRLVTFCLCFGSLVAVFPIPWVVSAVQKHSVINNTCTNATLGEVHFPEHCFVRDKTLLFYVLLSVLATGALFVIPLPGYMDTIAMTVVKTSNSGATYGGQRIWGSIGYCIFHFTAAYAADHYNVEGMSQYTAVYYFFAASCIIVFPMICYLIGQADFKEPSARDPADGKQGAAMRIQALSMIKNLDNIVFFITVLVSGLSMAIYMYFTLLLIKDIIPDAPKSKRSLMLVIGSISNLIMFPFTSNLIKLLRGPTQGIIVALSAYFVRYMIMSFTRNFTLLLAVNALHGFCFALAWSSMMEHLHKIVPAELKLTMFMLLSAVHFGICGLIANIAGGKLYDLYGGQLLFRGTGIMCAVWIAVMVLYHTMKCLKRKREAFSKTATQEETNATPSVNNTDTDVEMNKDIGTINDSIEVSDDYGIDKSNSSKDLVINGVNNGRVNVAADIGEET